MWGGARSMAVAVAVAVGLCGVASAQQGERVLRVPWTDIEPYTYAGRDGEVDGLFADMARELGQRLGYRIEFQRFADPLAMATAQADGLTDILPGVAALPMLGRSNLFSDPMATTRVRILVPTDTADEIDPGAVSGLRIGIIPPVAGAAADTFLARNEAVPYTRMALALVHLLEGRIDGLLVPEGPMMALARDLQLDHRIQGVGEPLLVYDRVVALNRARADMMPAINAAIAEMEADGTLAEIRREYLMDVPPPVPDVLSVGVVHYPPYQVVTEDGGVTGFAVETLKVLAERAGLKVEFRPIDYAAFGAGPGPQTYDMLPQVGVTPERMTRMDFTLPIETASWSLFVPADNDEPMAAQAAGLRGKRIAVSGNSNALRIAQSMPGVEVVVVVGLEGVIDAVLEGRADAAIYAANAMRAGLEAQGLAGRIVEEGPPLRTNVRAPALRLGLGVVRERLNGVIPGYIVSPEHRALREQWFGPTRFLTPARQWWLIRALVVLAAALAAVAVLLLVRQRLRARYLREVEAANARLDRKNHELAELNTLLARSNRELDDFAFVVSHDLKEPLRGIAINANFLKGSSDLDDKGRERLERINALCVRADELMSALLQYAHLSKTGAADTSAYPEKVVGVVRRMLSEQIEAANGRVSVVSRLPAVDVSPERLGIILRNLISNGLRFNTAETPTVEVGFTPRVEVDGIVLWDAFFVRDNGIGIDKAMDSKIFRVFSRLNPTSVFGEGTGVGLSFVKRIVEDRGGMVTFDAAPGSGTVFYFTLPLVSATRQAKAADAAGEAA